MLLKKIVIKNRTLNNSILELSIVSPYFGTKVKLDFEFPLNKSWKDINNVFNYRLLTSHLRGISMLQKLVFITFYSFFHLFMIKILQLRK